MRFPINDLITDILSRTVSESSQLVVQISDTLCFLSHPFGAQGQRTSFTLGSFESA